MSARWAVARQITAGGPGVAVNLDAFAPAEPMAARSYVNVLASGLGVALAGDESEALLTYLGVNADSLAGPDDDLPLADLVALVVSFPSFMRRDGGER
ncbi:MAG: hypothetical protein P8J50_05605 [Acidimicrobiales bacterium]|nr:hypothetical protein [Acidimicrobiales bacterium]